MNRSEFDANTGDAGRTQSGSPGGELHIDDTGSLFEALLANSLDLIYFKDLKSRFVRYSRSFAERLNLAEPNALIGKTDFDCYAEAHARPAFEDEQEIIRTGKPLIGKLEEERHADGRVTWVLTSKMPWRDKAGNIIGTFGISKEVTELKAAETTLKRTANLLDTLLENVPDCIYFKDLESKFVHFSRGFERLFNVPDKAMLLGKSDFDFFKKEHAQPAFDDEQEIIRTGRPIIGKLEQETHSDGRVTWCLTTKMPWRDKEGNVIGTFGLSRDVTEMKEAEAKLEQLHKQLIEASREAGMAEIATSVLHNVGNVLNSINVSATLIADCLKRSKSNHVARAASLLKEHAADIGAFMQTDPKGRQFTEFLDHLGMRLGDEHKYIQDEIDSLTRNVEHIKEIVARQQEYARPSGVLETVRVQDLVEDALKTNNAASTREEVALTRDFAEPLPEIEIEKHKAMQILVNLISNARQACIASDHPEKQVAIRIRSENEHIQITVLDNGVGIAAGNLTRIFSHGFTTRKGGHGFALHNAALLAKEMGGKLAAQSDGLGKGAAFTLTLPLKGKQGRPHQRP